MVSTHLKHISQFGSFPQVGVKNMLTQNKTYFYVAGGLKSYFLLWMDKGLRRSQLIAKHQRYPKSQWLARWNLHKTGLWPGNGCLTSTTNKKQTLTCQLTIRPFFNWNMHVQNCKIWMLHDDCLQILKFNDHVMTLRTFGSFHCWKKSRTSWWSEEFHINSPHLLCIYTYI